MLLLLTWLGSTAQAQQDSLSDDTIYAMKKGAERAIQDYNAAMRELVNPRISKSYRDRIVSEFTTPGNRQIFTEGAYVVYDYDGDYLPPLDTKERPVLTYLTDGGAANPGGSGGWGSRYRRGATHDHRTFRRDASGDGDAIASRKVPGFPHRCIFPIPPTKQISS